MQKSELGSKVEELPSYGEFAFINQNDTVLVYVDPVSGPPSCIMRTATDFKVNDGFRWYQVFSLAFSAVLSWSPILRDALGVKRRSSRLLEKGEDGVRAQMLEEYIISLAMSERDWLINNGTLTEVFFQEVRECVTGLEVESFHAENWRIALNLGRSAWRNLNRNGSSIVQLDRARQDLSLVTISEIDGSPSNNSVIADSEMRASSITGTLIFHICETKEGVAELFRQLDDGSFVNTGSKAEEWSHNYSDGFRWHDVFHLTNFALLGWSPVFEALLELPRHQGNSLRHDLLEEAIVARAYSAFINGDSQSISAAAYSASRLCEIHAGVPIKAMDWERAFQHSWELKQLITSAGSGRIFLDLDGGSIAFFKD